MGMWWIDKDSDDDGIVDGEDNCYLLINSRQGDMDSDGKGDVCDIDRDGDFVSNADEEAAGTDPEDIDSDGDTISDGDEWGCEAVLMPVSDVYESQDSEASESETDDEAIASADAGTSDTVREQIRLVDCEPSDTDGDGEINALDEDSDGDTLSDYKEAGDDDINTPPVDSDNDGVPDYLQFDEVEEDDEDSEDDPPAEEEGCNCSETRTRPEMLMGTFIALMALGRRRKRHRKGHRCITKNESTPRHFKVLCILGGMTSTKACSG